MTINLTAIIICAIICLTVIMLVHIGGSKK